MFTTVTSTDGLWAAIASAHSGDTILLAPGAYAELRLNGVNIVGNVTITSQDAAHPASIAGLHITSSSGLTFSNLETTVDPQTGFTVMLGGVSHMTFDHMNMHGAAVGDGNGIMVRNSDSVSVTNSNIHDLQNGVVHLTSTNLIVAGNTIHAIQTDGVHGAGSNYVTVTGNTITDFHPLAGQHPDAIQFFTQGTIGSTHDLTITNNIIERGAGQPFQGIFIGSETQAPYQNVTISGNAVIGTGYQGIAVGYSDHTVITNNLVEGYQDLTSWINVNHSTNASVTNNVATAYQFDAATDTGLVQANDALTAQGVIGDTSMLSTFEATYTTANLTVVPPPASAATAAPAAPPPPPYLGPAVTIYGTSGADHLIGTSGNDVIDGKAGPDTISGGLGNDIYVINDARDMVVEAFGGGTDTVFTSLPSYTLGNQLENLHLYGNAGQTGIGNALNNVLTGNSVASTLNGEGGNDTLVSTGGVDTMTGGTGNDVFQFNHLPSGVDVITDFIKGGDHLNLHGLLAGYQGSNPVADHWVQFIDATNGITVSVDPDGPAGSAGFTPVAVLTGVHGSLTAGTDWIF